jgi:hypothetical protein
MIQDPINFHANDALCRISRAEYGAHYVVRYPDLFTKRELYSNYIKKQFEENSD